jgi:bacillithiol synthase
MPVCDGGFMDRVHQAYIKSGMHAHAFFPLGAGDFPTRAQRVKDAAKKRISSSLIAVIKGQNAGSPRREDALRALETGNTALVVTGQQVGLFLGPLYTIAKAASAVVWARQLERETGVRCVPLFWLQSEDHDFAEIAHVSVPRGGGLSPVALTMNDALGGARVCVGQHVLHDLPWKALEEALGDAPHAKDTLALLRAHYKDGASPVQAFAGVLLALFEAHGLLVFDPRNATTSMLAAPVLERAIKESARIADTLQTRSLAIEQAGYQVQIPPRERTMLPFVHTPDALGPRQRPGLEAVERTLETLRRDPMCLSTSALLRPIVQDTLLPTALYLGGPAEIDYFAQASALYPIFDLPPPLVALRGRIQVITPRVAATLEKLGISADDVDAGEEALAMRLLRRGGAQPPGTPGAPGLEGDEGYAKAFADGPSETWLRELEAHFASWRAPDALQRHAEKTRRSIAHRLRKLERRHARFVLEQETVLKERIRMLTRWLRPGGAPQERVHGFMAFAARSGGAELVDKIVSALDPAVTAPVSVRL